MRITGIAIAALAVSGQAAFAGGLDRSGQDIGIIFEDGTYAELSYGGIMPSVTGAAYANVADAYSQTKLGFKTDFTDALSFALIIDQPFGSDVSYKESSATTTLGGTTAVIDSRAITGVLNYNVNDNFSVHAGVRSQTVSGSVTLDGLAYSTALGGLTPYNAVFAADQGVGWLAGAAFEMTEIALRVALTYNSEVTHDMATSESFLGGPVVATGTTTSNTPRSVNLDFQSGIAADTLLMGSVRWAEWGAFDVTPPLLGADLADINDSWSYMIGVGRRFSDQWSGVAQVSFESAGDPLVSPLSPTNGLVGLALAGVYTMDNYTITGGVSFTSVGDATPDVGGTPVATFAGNTVMAAGLTVGMHF